jgi:hypothetical protein
MIVSMTSNPGAAVLSTAEEHELVGALAEMVLEQAAPEELALFPELTDEYFRDPDAAVHVRHRDEAVGFGLELAMLTPYVLAVVTPVVRMLASLVEESVHDELKPTVAQLVHRLFRRVDPTTSEGTEPPELTADQLRRIRTTAYERGRQLGLDEPRADLLADSVVGRLATA